MLRAGLQELRRAGPLALGLATLAAGWLGYGFWRLTLVHQRFGGGVDLRLRWREVLRWWDGVDIYRFDPDAMYPPASYLMFTPIVGWGPFRQVRWLYAALMVLCLVLLVRTLLRAAGGDRRQRILLVAAALASYPLGAGIGNGQVALPVLLFVLVMAQASSAPAAGLALVAAVLKPTLGGPFAVLVLTKRRGAVAAALAAIVYLALTLGATLPLGRDPVERLEAWAERGVQGAEFGANRGEGSIGTRNQRSLETAVLEGSGRPDGVKARRAPAPPPEPLLTIKSINVHSLLAWWGRPRWMTLGTVLTVLAAWAWALRRRAAPLWTRLGVLGITTVLCTYHAWYDHALLLLPFVALQRIGTGEDAGGLAPRHARRLAVWLALSLLAPGGLYLLPHPWNNAYVIAQTAIWLTAAAALVRHAALVGGAHAEGQAEPGAVSG
jgi:hypothetical protein